MYPGFGGSWLRLPDMGSRKLAFMSCALRLTLWNRQAYLGYNPAPGPTLEKVLCHTRLVSGTYDKYRDSEDLRKIHIGTDRDSAKRICQRKKSDIKPKILAASFSWGNFASHLPNESEDSTHCHFVKCHTHSSPLFTYIWAFVFLLFSSIVDLSQTHTLQSEPAVQCGWDYADEGAWTTHGIPPHLQMNENSA